jgi:hypothetical protein
MQRAPAGHRGSRNRQRDAEQSQHSPLGTVRHDALTLASWGWRVLPCRPGSKLPATARGFHDATDDPDTILGWWDEDPRRNVAVATGAVSGVVVLDVDPGGADTLAALQAKHGPLPATLGASTPRGGRHGFYLHPGRPTPCSAGKLGPALDVRGDGGYVLVAPSVVDGKPYRWRTCPWPVPALAALPGPWVDLLAAPADPPRPSRPEVPPPPATTGRVAAWTAAAIRGEVDAVAAAPIGTRNHTLNRAAFRLGQLAAAGLIDVDAARGALAAAAAACGLGAREADRTIRSGMAAGTADPAALPAVVAA